MRLYKYNHWFCLLTVLLSACADIIEPDISQEQVVLLSPPDSAVTTRLAPNFFWEEVPGARVYRLQIVSPSFERPAFFHTDTVVSAANFSMTLEPGTFQWRVKAMNNGYETGFSTATFFIDSTSSLNEQEVRLTKPANGQYFSNSVVEFEWELLPMANKYLFQLLSPVKFDSLLTGNSLVLEFPEDSQTYTWQVTALNDEGSKRSARYSFFIDNTPPAAPSLLSPASDTLYDELPVELKWSRSSRDVAYDSLYLYGSNQSTLIAGFPLKVEGETFTITITRFNLGTGTYYWTVKSVDKAGNIGPLSDKRSFRVR
jgi:hypothetical protein